MNQLRPYLRYIPLGVVIWLAFLIFIRLVGSSVFSVGNPLLIVFFIAAFPLLWVTIIALAPIFGVPVRKMFMPVVVMTLTALMIDGIAIGFIDLYGSSDDQVRAAAAYLLWGAGVGLLVSLWVSGEE